MPPKGKNSPARKTAQRKAKKVEGRKGAKKEKKSKPSAEAVAAQKGLISTATAVRAHLLTQEQCCMFTGAPARGCDAAHLIPNDQLKNENFQKVWDAMPKGTRKKLGGSQVRAACRLQGKNPTNRYNFIFLRSDLHLYFDQKCFGIEPYTDKKGVLKYRTKVNSGLDDLAELRHLERCNIITLVPDPTEKHYEIQPVDVQLPKAVEPFCVKYHYEKVFEKGNAPLRTRSEIDGDDEDEGRDSGPAVGADDLIRDFLDEQCKYHTADNAHDGRRAAEVPEPRCQRKRKRPAACLYCTSVIVL